MERNALEGYLERYLDVRRFRDYCPNGLQVEGRAEIRRIVTGVTASLALLQAADAAGADAVFVHHGYFWRGEDGRVTGTRRARLKFLLERGINLFAYHLPLDAHPEVGNNVQLARQLGLAVEGNCARQEMVWHGRPAAPLTLAAFAEHVAARLGRLPQLIGDPAREVRTLAWCSGAAQNYLEEAVAQGVDAYLSGEISEQTVHLARESGVAYIAAGHHATERYGVAALGAHLAAEHGLEHEFIDIPNPV